MCVPSLDQVYRAKRPREEELQTPSAGSVDAHPDAPRAKRQLIDARLGDSGSDSDVGVADTPSAARASRISALRASASASTSREVEAEAHSAFSFAELESIVAHVGSNRFEATSVRKLVTRLRCTGVRLAGGDAVIITVGCAGTVRDRLSGARDCSAG